MRNAFCALAFRWKGGPLPEWPSDPPARTGLPDFFKIMTNISHYYRCLGCSKHHDAESEAVTCCAVVQEIFECKLCGDRFAAESWATQHISQFHRIPNGASNDVRTNESV